jgi:hypothetical protein
MYFHLSLLYILVYPFLSYQSAVLSTGQRHQLFFLSELKFELHFPVDNLILAYANGSFNQTEIEFKMDEQLNTITKDINEFGKISLKGDQTHVRLNCQLFLK